MAFQATVYNVMIASPGDVQGERLIIREIVEDWNVVHASSRQIVLLPVGWETHSTPLMGDRPQSIINWQVLKSSDLLIAAFWTRLGTPTGKQPSGTVEEIEEHLEAKKPALLYFSTAAAKPDDIDRDQYDALKEFQAVCKRRGLYEVYESLPEFRDKVRRHLSLTLNKHPYFQDTFQSPSSEAAVTGIPVATGLSRDAQELLVAAVTGDGSVYVGRGGFLIQANRKDFVDASNNRSRARWVAVVEELAEKGLLERAGTKGEVFRVTQRGYQVADNLKDQS